MRALRSLGIGQFLITGRATVLDFRDGGGVLVQDPGQALIRLGRHQDDEPGQRIGFRIAAAIWSFPFAKGRLGDAAL